MNIKYNLFFIFSTNKDNLVSKIRRSIWIMNIVALVVTFIGIMIVYLSPQVSQMPQIMSIPLGLLLVFIGSHILWAGLASLRGLEERLEGVEEG